MENSAIRPLRAQDLRQAPCAPGNSTLCARFAMKVSPVPCWLTHLIPDTRIPSGTGRTLTPVFLWAAASGSLYVCMTIQTIALQLRFSISQCPRGTACLPNCLSSLRCPGTNLGDEGCSKSCCRHQMEKYGNSGGVIYSCRCTSEEQRDRHPRCMRCAFTTHAFHTNNVTFLSYTNRKSVVVMEQLPGLPMALMFANAC